MVVLFGAHPASTRILSRLDRFHVEHHVEWESFARRARTAECAVVVVLDERMTDETLTHLHALAHDLGPVPLIVVLANAAAHGLHLARIAVDAVATTDSPDLEDIIARLLRQNTRSRIAAAATADGSGVPPAVARAFDAALCDAIPIRNVRKFALVSGDRQKALAAALVESAPGRAGLTLHWFVDAALLIRASELFAAHGWNELRVAAELGVSDRTLRRIRQRVLGPASKYDDLRLPSTVARTIWSAIAGVSP